MNLSDPLELQGSSLYTVGRNGLVTQFVVPTGSEPVQTYGVQSQTRDILSAGVGILLLFGLVFLLLFAAKR